ncbi:AAA family ATPase [Marinobacter nanhaiticus D15-8W]|uniref:ATP-dependent Clp protease ATP-binding subunit n=1 Tax=Marinobacter nanhaiticus D15-8W TaxID=626887 RepID=N6WS45_9GAMM|nr:AAA family ATPase [Marinobacter nanhaiticus]ENO13852.1 ATP-dependent Clp protease ATP-binding subunit [Marinobacter nanhaiticus D15-8W]BES71228.1 AAA family ATPase [Marinobacter nanhaiticus D15-8W]
MPFINERIEENQTAAARSAYRARPRRASRFVFEPHVVMGRIRERIVGQDESLQALEAMLLRVKADIGPDDRPLAVHLLMGPTGVGKTESVRLLAEAIRGKRDGLCRIDMNTLAQEHYAAALTGAPPGYVGSKEGYSLFDIDAVQGSFSKPGIVLFDEVEKASPEVVRTLLNVLDTGRLVFPSGNREVDFRNTLIFMTSNVGAQEAARYRERFRRGWRHWFGLAPRAEAAVMDRALHRAFDPEFLNRIDGVHIYNRLGIDRLDDLLSIELARLNQRLSRRGATLTLADSLRHYLCGNYDPRFGARDIIRGMRSLLEPPLARALMTHEEAAAFRGYLRGGAVCVEPHQFSGEGG